jgi:hypothetical protein
MIFVRGALHSLTVFILHFPPKTLSVVAEMVSFMAELLLSEEQRKEKQLEQEWLTYNEACVQKEFAKRFGNKPVPIPATLAPGCWTGMSEEIWPRCASRNFLAMDKVTY